MKDQEYRQKKKKSQALIWWKTKQIDKQEEATVTNSGKDQKQIDKKENTTESNSVRDHSN